MPAVAGLTPKPSIGKGERAKRFSRRTYVLAAWLGLMFIGTNVALLGVQSARASTTLYDIQFSLLGSGIQQTGAAVIGQAGDYWNFITTASGTASLLDSGNNSSSVSFSWAGSGTYSFSSSFGGGDANLMGGYIFASSSQGMSFSGLPANRQYALYIYTQGDSASGGRELQVTVNGTTYTAAPADASATTFIAGQNYLSITGVTDGSGNLQFTNNYAVGEADINGIQLSVASVIATPSITAQPTNQTVAEGGTVNLSVTATGDAPLACQWLNDGRMLVGATNSALNIARAAVTDSGVYYVAITNASGMGISLPVTVAVCAPQLMAWGDNYNGNLGDGTTTEIHSPKSVAGNVVTAAAGGGWGGPPAAPWDSAYSLYLKSDGTLWAMGDNSYGYLGDGTTTQRESPVPVVGGSNVVAMAAGDYHSLFLKSDGTLWAMGANDYGKLGDGTTTDRHSPVEVASHVVAIAAGWDHSLFLKSDGTLWAMGYNVFGELGDGTTANRHSPVAVVGGSNVVAVAAGGYHSLYLKIDGTLWAMGYNGYGQLGDGTTTDQHSPKSVTSNVVAIAAGALHSLYLKHDGTLWAMGANKSGELGDGTTTERHSPVTVTNNVVAVAAGGDHSLFIKSDGTLLAMGYNGYGQLGDGTTTQRNSPVAVPRMFLANVISGCYADHTLAVGLPLMITSQPVSQTVWAGDTVAFTVTASSGEPLTYQWHFNGSAISGASASNYTLTGVTTNNLGDYTVVVGNAIGSVTSGVATLTLGTAPSITTEPASQTVAEGGTVNLSVTATSESPLTYQWFKNGGMILGATNSTLSVANAGATNSGIYYVAAINPYTPCLSRPVMVTVGAPILMAWGDNYDGDLGDGTATQRNRPVSVTGNVVAGAAGAMHSLYLKSDGTLWAMGGNDFGQLGDGSKTPRNTPVTVVGGSNVVAVSAGAYHSIFLKNDGTVWAVGYNCGGELGDGTKITRLNAVQVASNVSAVAAGA